jgi:ribosomal protein S18 acetylase RimI-like enzyme
MTELGEVLPDPHDLYGLPLDRFVPERTALAKALRGGGRREQAAEVAAMRKPSVAAWAVNQLVRTQDAGMSALFEAGEELQQAQSQLLAGRGDRVALHEAVSHEREAVKRLVETARGLLSSDGHELTPATLDRVAETLHAAAVDKQARAEVRHGRLHRELQHAGLGEAKRVRSRRKSVEPEPAQAQIAAAPPEPEVRAATAEDAPAVGRMLDAFNREFKDPTPGPAWLAERITQLLTEDTVVLLAGPGPDAVAVMRFRPGLWSAGLECYLAELYVVPDRRGRGLGRALMLAVIDAARERGADWIELGTSEDDHAARALYESLGFTNRERGPDGPITYFYELEL